MNGSSLQRRGVRVEVSGLRRAFDGQVVLNDVNLTVDEGEIFVIMGPSGSGKSVLLKHIIGLETPDAGEIRLNGDSVSSPGVMDRHRLAMVFQSGALLNSLTVGENVGLYLREHRAKSETEIDRIVTEKLDQVGLKGLEARNVSDLSGGMKKRVAIARALVIEPELLLYDEPTSELDPLMAVVIAEEIARLNARTGVTSIVVTHDRELAFGIANRIALILNGEILVVGSPEEIKACAHPSVRQFLNASFQHSKLSP